MSDTEERPTLGTRWTRPRVAAGYGARVETPAVRRPATSGLRHSYINPPVFKVADLTGPGITDRFGMRSAGLGIPVGTADGGLLFVFGAASGGHWMSGGDRRGPAGLYSATTDLNSGIEWSQAVGGDGRQFWDGPHGSAPGTTVLPTDVIRIGRSLFLFATVVRPYPQVISSEIWRSDDGGPSWRLVTPDIPPGHLDGRFQMVTWALGDDGHVYVYSTGFRGDGNAQGVILQRVPAGRLHDLRAYEGWGWDGREWTWGVTPTPILDGKVGEMCLRPMDGTWVLTFLNEDDPMIEAIVLPAPDADLAHAGRRRALILTTPQGTEAFNRVAQPYGGYIVPGSTLREFHFVVSQWTAGRDRFSRVMQFRVLGLDLF